MSNHKDDKSTSDKLSRLTHIKFNKSGSPFPEHLDEVVENSADLKPASKQEKTVEKSVDTEKNIEAAAAIKKLSEDKLETAKEPVSPFKRFVEPKPETSKKSTPKVSLPKFLERFQGGFAQASETTQAANTEVPSHRALALVDETKPKEKPFNPNSFSSIFNKDHQEISGIKRVFKKSIALLVLNLASFGLLSLISVNFFTTNWLISLITAVVYITTTNIFFIIVADRSYVWLAIASKIVLLILVNSFLGMGFDIITIFFSVIVAILIFSAYSELEKIQLSSRLFSISHITAETTRILGTVVILLLSLGVFNSIVSQTADVFFSRTLLANDVIVDRALVGKGNPFGLSGNRLLVKGESLFGAGNTKYTLRDFLERNYKGGQVVVSETEQTDIIIECQNKAVTSAAAASSCGNAVAEERDKRLLAWQQEALPKINYGLDEVLDKTKFQEVTRQIYVYFIKSISNTNSSVAALPIPRIIPANYIFPGIVAITLYLTLFIFKFALSWMVGMLTWLVWSLLRALGFSKIEVETVEAEIVSI
jgi:hypothetical protein